MTSNIRNEGKATRFKPGQSGNPAGRPRRKAIRDLLVAVLEVPLSPEALKLVRPGLRADLSEGETYGDILVMSMIIKAANKGDLATFREILSCETEAW